MKTRLLNFIAFGVSLLLIASCSSPKSVADKALKLVGLGTFAPSDVDRYLGHSYGFETLKLFTDYDDIFDNALIDTDEALNFRKYGSYKETSKTSFFYFKNAVFEKWELVKEDELSYDLYGITDYSRLGDLSPEAIKSMKDYESISHADYQESGNITTYLVAKDVPAKILRYKLDNKFFANLTVIKVPDVGYRVCAFRIE
ncbi:MAG: hypothetical protein IJV27_05765 [Prevotella sp.]|nr:hypothetical protein [Prevotella sp.]